MKIEEGSSKKNAMQQFSLYRAIHRGGMIRELQGNNKEEIITNAMKKIASALSLDADVITDLLLDRERLMPTALSNGVAVPHTREFLIKGPFDVVAIANLKEPVEWGALDDKPVHTLFFLFASDDKRHLHLLAKLAHLSSSEEGIEMMKSNPDKKAFLEYVKEWESSVRHLSE